MMREKYSTAISDSITIQVPLEKTWPRASAQKGKKLAFRAHPRRNFSIVRLTNSRFISSAIDMKPIRPPEFLVSAHFVGPSKIRLVFGDASFLLEIEKLGMPIDRIRWTTARASPTGDIMIITGVKGDNVPIDSATLRYLVDTDYAAKIDASLKALRFTRAELQRIASENPPPDEWYDEPERDLRRESWK